MTQRIKNQQGIVDLSRYGLNGFAWFGTAEQDPKTSPIKLYDGIGNIGKAELSQPLTVQNGEYKNKNGQTVYPVTEIDEYSVLIANENGTPVYQRGREIADDTGGSGTSAVYDAVYDNLQQSLAADLSAYDFIFIKAENVDWKGTPTGADINNAYYRTGLTGSPSTGDAELFYDSAGNEWVIAPSRVEQGLTTDVAGLDSRVAVNEAAIALTDSITSYVGNYTTQSTGAGEEVANGITVLMESGKTYEIDLTVNFEDGVTYSNACMWFGLTGRVLPNGGTNPDPNDGASAGIAVAVNDTAGQTNFMPNLDPSFNGVGLKQKSIFKPSSDVSMSLYARENVSDNPHYIYALVIRVLP